VTPIAIMKQHSTIGVVNPSKYPDILIRSKLAKFMCIPGVRPVNVPTSVPKIIAAIISRNILVFLYLICYYFWFSFEFLYCSCYVYLISLL